MTRNTKKESKPRTTDSNKPSSNQEVDDSADQEADDEHSDWPANDKFSDQNDSSTDIELADDNSVQFRVVPWWEETPNGTDFLPTEQKSSYTQVCLKNSNYQLINQNQSEEKVKEFNVLLNGALGLMSPESRVNFQSKINKSMVRT